MKFLCGGCRTKYQISDEKLHGKVLTIRCKKCGAKILVRESLRRDAGPGTAIAPIAEEAESDVARGEGQLRSVQLGGAGPFASAFEMSMAAAQGTDDMPTSIAPVPANLDTAGIEWYVAIDGHQHGPFAFGEVVRRIKAREVLSRHYAWHEGMENWQRIRDLADLSVHLPEAGARRGPPPPPPTSVLGGDAAANVVDFASRRAERVRRDGARSEADGTGLGPEGWFDEATDAQESGPPDSLAASGRAFGVEASREATNSAEPTERAIAISGTAAASGGDGAARPLDLHFDHADDIFANLPRATDADMVPRESTRFFVAAAGVNKRRSQQKLWMVVGIVAALCFAGFIGAWATGVVKVSLPVIGNPFATAENDQPDEDVVVGGGTGGLDSLIRTKKPVKDPPLRRASRTRRIGPSGDPSIAYVDDDTDDPSRRHRLDDEPERVGLDGLTTGAGEIPSSVGHTLLPMADPELPPVEEGSLSEDTIAKVVTAKKKSVSICYQQGLRADRNLRGKLEIRVTIQPTGRVSRAEIETTAFRGSKIGRCIADKIKDWRFPASSGGSQDVVLPFILEKQAY
ncbi:MAG: zinc-ribbon domain-containing protein [Deltaproteobacteria bacterium]|nr:zinc-ribbon domain-containing protein [Deltaproteobacteria bacterium]